MTPLKSTVFRVGNIGAKRFVIGLHPQEKETLISVRELGRAVAYVIPISAVRIQAAMAYGRAELAAKREARKFGIKWKVARKKFRATVVPPKVSARKHRQNPVT